MRALQASILLIISLFGLFGCSAPADDPRPNIVLFAYLPFTAPHWPLQVPDDWLDHCAGEYDEGIDAADPGSVDHG